MSSGSPKVRPGLITTIYFWLYAGGQLVSGWMCTKKDPKHVLILGLILTVLCNALIGFVHSYEALLLLWSLNGLALGGVISGAVADWIGWTGMYWLWAGLSTAALVLMLCVRGRRQKV